MSKLTNDEFITFLKSYESKDKCYDSISNISWPKDINGNNLLSKEPLINIDDVYMYSLDDMCKDGSETVFNSKNLPSTVDALYYKVNDDKLIIYFIEFKWSNLDKFKPKKSFTELIGNLSNKKSYSNNDLVQKLMDLKRSYDDSEILFSLRLKPFESLFIVLPKLYKKYCDDVGCECKDLNEFFSRNEIKVLTFVGKYTNMSNVDEVLPNKKSMKINIKSKRNRHKERYRYNVTAGPKGTNGSILYKQYKRLELSSFVDFAEIYPKSFFNKFLENEGLLN